MASLAQSSDHRHLLDIIDKLRSEGTGKYVDLPEIIVCGDQSVGKSSVLEAISGMSFPTNDVLCTRFPTELVLRRDEVRARRVSINPGPERSEEERARLLRFQFSMESDDENSLRDVTEKAKESMQFSDTRDFSTDTLRVELSGPNQPHLTIVDLPGLYRAGNKDQSVYEAMTVKEMVKSYMQRPRSIILAVVSAKVDAALQEVTELARKLDPTGDRTLGLITKPDCLDVGSDMERSFLDLAQNKSVEFRLGWHVLKNRSYEMRNASLAERNSDEEFFFSKGAWAFVDRSSVGVASLKLRLSNVLKDQILHQLPGLIQDVEEGVLDCQQRLRQLGSFRRTVPEQRRYLLQVSQQFSTLMRAAVDGVYNDAFFGSAKTEEGYQKRLRAVIQNTLTDFEETMRKRGHTLIIVDNSAHAGRLGSGRILRSHYLDEVKQMMRRNRGCELPGTFNPLIIGQLFLEQCRPWQSITIHLVEDVLESVRKTTQDILDSVAIPEVAEGIFRVISMTIEALREDFKSKVAELMKPYITGHPVTYNHYLTDQVQKAQSDRRRRTLTREFDNIFGSDLLTCGGGGSAADYTALVNVLVEDSEADMERHAASLAVDYMQAYYKVARKTLIDSVASLAVEQCLMQRLPSLFNPDVVFELDDAALHRLVAESENTAIERSRCAEKLTILESSLIDLKRLIPFRSTITSGLQDSESENQSEIREDDQSDKSDQHLVDHAQLDLTPEEEPASCLDEERITYLDEEPVPCEQVDWPNLFHKRSSSNKKKKKKPTFDFGGAT